MKWSIGLRILVAHHLLFNAEMKIYKVRLPFVAALASIIHIADATIIYSELQNLTLAGQPDSPLTIES